MSVGNLFQTRGPAALKALSPKLVRAQLTRSERVQPTWAGKRIACHGQTVTSHTFWTFEIYDCSWFWNILFRNQYCLLHYN